MYGYRVTGQGRPEIRRRGVTLIEAVLFISVALGLIVGGIVFYQQASLTARMNRQAMALSSLFAEARLVFSQTDVSGLQQALPLDDILIASGSVPGDIVGPPIGDAQTRLRSAWGTPLDIWIRPWANQDILIVATIDGLPVAACARLAVVDSGGTGVATAGVMLVMATNTRDAPSPELAPPIPPDVAAASCAQADTDGDGSVALILAVTAYQ